MQYKITVDTPAGEAGKTEPQLKIHIIGMFKRINQDTYINEDKSQFIWVIESEVRDYFRIQKNIVRFQALSTAVLKFPMVKKQLKKTSREDYIKLLKYFGEGIKIELKDITDIEKSELVKDTFWNKVKTTITGR